MTSLHIEIMLHYYAKCDSFPWNGDAPAQREFLKQLLDEQMLRKSDLRESADYQITPRGVSYIEALQAVRLPVQTWVVPQ